jgi:prephenate dehydrogenase
MKLFNKVAIVGVGLIGGSLGLAIKNKGIARKVIGIGHRQKSIDQAIRRRAIDDGSLELSSIKDADLVILAPPVGEILKILPKLPQFINSNCLVIDAGSTKSEIMKLAQKSKVKFIGCHPLAGMEKKGVENAKRAIFQDSLCLLVPLENIDKAALGKIQRFWKTLGARTKIIDAKSHDRILAFTSHLPHAVVFSLIDCIRPGYLPYAARGLKDTTRIGLSDPCLWRDIFLTNRKELLFAIKNFKGSLARLELLIKNNQPKEIATYLQRAGIKRNEFLK